MRCYVDSVDSLHLKGYLGMDPQCLSQGLRLLESSMAAHLHATTPISRVSCNHVWQGALAKPECRELLSESCFYVPDCHR